MRRWTPQSEQRDALAATHDRRAVLTRRRPVAAYQGTLREEGTNVSVASIAEAAGVGRSTFYTHFSTLDELAVATIAEMLDEANEAEAENRRTVDRNPPADLLGTLNKFVRRLDANRNVLLRGAEIYTSVREYSRRRIFSDLYPFVVNAFPAVTESEQHLRTVFVAEAVTATLVAWLEHPSSIPSDRLASLMLELVPDWLTVGAGTPTTNPRVP